MARRRTFAVVAIATVALTALAGCAAAVPTESISVLAGNEILTADLGPDVSARGVVLAAVLLVAGDVDKAVKNGVVTESEVLEARQAIADGTLDIWRQRVESDGATP